MKIRLILGLLAFVAMSSQVHAASCIAFATDCDASIILSYDAGAGEVCYADNLGDEAILTVYDANGNLVRTASFRCPDVSPGPPIVDPC